MPNQMPSQVLADAKAIINNPKRFADQSALRTFAWSVLMSERGKRVDQLRISLMQKGSTFPRSHAIEIADARLADCLARTSPQ